MKTVALMTVRNEIFYLERCLRHLFSQGIEVYLIDNDSTDGSAELAKRFLGRGLLAIERLAYPGYFDLGSALDLSARLAREIEADWFIHHDADEIREAPPGWGTLADGIARADQEGYNALNFDEFVFVPLENDNHENSDYVTAMRHYYFFEPAPFRRVNAWKKTGQPVDLESSGGHQARFEGQRIHPQPFVLRHYPALSRGHLVQKYSSRHYAEKDLARGWFGARRNFDPGSAEFPDRARLKTVDSRPAWDRSDPWKRHPFFSSSGT
jgi:glycosyltransferase involved in cell wall biosynthesis